MMKKARQFNIEENIIECDVSYRGGTIKVDVSSVFPNVEKEAVMGAYQNYLGGGLRGSVNGASMFDPSKLSKTDQKVFIEPKERIKKYFHSMSSSDEIDMNDEWNTPAYDVQQSMPVSGY